MRSEKGIKMGIRNSAKAVIIQEGKLLAIKKQDKEGYYYILPGGGQEHGENLHLKKSKRGWMGERDKIWRNVRCIRNTHD